MNREGVTVGVDNGISGGLCVLCNWDCRVIEYYPMPVLSVGGKNEVDSVALTRLLRELHEQDTTMTVCVEEPLRHAKSSQAMRSMSISFGKTMGVCDALGLESYRIQVLDWQKAVLGKRIPKGKTKEFALAAAQKLWPKETWLASSRCKTPHDGIVDAALIAHHHLQSTWTSEN